MKLKVKFTVTSTMKITVKFAMKITMQKLAFKKHWENILYYLAVMDFLKSC